MNLNEKRNRRLPTLVLFWVIFVLQIFVVRAQREEIDSLRQILIGIEQTNKLFKKDTVYIETLIKLGKKYSFINSDSLLAIAQKSFEFSEEIDYSKGIIKSYRLKGRYYSDKGKNTESISSYKKALLIAKKEQDRIQEAHLLRYIGSEYFLIGSYPKAMEFFERAKVVATEVNDKRLLSIIVQYMASFYEVHKDYEQTLVFYEQAANINKELGDEIFSAKTFANWAYSYSELNKYDLAMLNVDKALKVFEKRELLDWLAYVYVLKGRIYLDLKNFDLALKWYQKSLSLHKKIDDVQQETFALIGIAKTYLSLQKDSLAIEYAQKGYANALEINSLEGQEESSELLYRVNKKIKNSDKSLYYLEIFKKLSDSLRSEGNKSSLTLLKTKMNHEKQTERLITENEKRLARQRLIIYSSLFGLLAMGIIILTVLRSRNVQKQLNLKLRHKNKLIEKRELELAKSNETKDRLFSIIGHDLRSPIMTLDGLLNLFSTGEIKKNEMTPFISKIKLDVNNILMTLNNLLSWGQSQIQGDTTKPSNILIKEIVLQNMNLLRETANKKNINLINHINESAIVWADQNQIDVVIRNLMSNAIKFTLKNGCIEISAEEKEEHIIFCVKDDGVGMTKDVKEKILAINSNITTYGTENEKGTGLGLSLCKEMIEKNNGRIWVESEVNKGSSFFFTIPKEKNIKNDD